MILHALKEYYHRKSAIGAIPKNGWVEGGIDFLLELDFDGKMIGIADLREMKGKKFIPKRLHVPAIGKQALKHTNSGNDANLLWDNAGFVFGLGNKGAMRLQSMLQAMEEWLGRKTDDPGIEATRKFLQMGLENRAHFEMALNHPEYEKIFAKGGAKISFKLAGSEGLVFHSPLVSDVLERVGHIVDKKTVYATCLVTGENNVPIEETHPVTKGVWGGQVSGTSIVSFNADAFNSYGKKQSLNAPVSKVVVSQYAKALYSLLNSSQQCMHVGDATIIFWSGKESALETDFSSFFEEPAKDNPAAGTEKIKAVLESLETGSYLEDDGDNVFYILGLAPNSGRIMIRFWQVATVAEFATRVGRYFNDFKIVKPPNEPEYYSLWRILVNVATQDKSENIPPNLTGDFMRAILGGTPYPATLLHAALRRIKSDTEKRVKPVRAALIKAYLNRYYEFYPNHKYKEVAMVLDIDQTSVGYQLGRLFATLERIQEEASPGINSTIRERFYGSACSAPVTVFSNLMRLKNHHLAKLENRGRIINFERLLGEIISKLGDFPAHLSLHEQGLFAIGYYHQRQFFFTKKDTE